MIGALYGVNHDFAKTAFAIGDLTIDWGVPAGNPIFVINNLAPGQNETRNVQVTNNSPVIRPVGVRGIKSFETNNLSNVLTIEIKQGVTTLYGPVSLNQFFLDSGGPEGIPLSNLNPTNSTIYTFKVTFNANSGNEFQGSEVIFDLKIGISIKVPEECKNIVFSGDPIFGTAGSDHISGTPGNDLIFGFEGADHIEGKLGDDCIIGGAGSDKLIGNEGNDVLLGNGGDDSLEGNSGDDYLDGGEGNDSLKGGNGVDHLEGGEGKDSLDGGNQNDFLDGGPGLFDSGKGGAQTDTCINLESKSQCELP